MYILESCREMIKEYIRLMDDEAFNRMPLSKQIMILNRMEEIRKELSEKSDDVQLEFFYYFWFEFQELLFVAPFFISLTA